MSKSFLLAGAHRRMKLCFAAAMAAAGALLILVPGCFAQAAADKAAAPYLNSAVPIQKRVDDLVSKMTLEEKVSQMQNHAAAIPRLGVAEYDWWSEALHGVARSGYATVFPQAIGMAATWDAPLIHEEAHMIGIEARGRYNSAVREDNHAIFYGMDFWSPNVNIFRDPRWGRGQETYGEDPFLTGQLGIQFVTGLQGDDPDTYLAISTPKHFDVHSGPESERHRFNVDVSAHDLEDTYLPAFRATIVDGHADSIMCAYNAIDGAPACANTMLLQKTLRDDWKFKGYVVSDCGAIGDIANGHKYAPSIEQASVDAVRAGTDLSCGDEYATLVKAVHDGLIKESEIDTAVKRLMTARIRMGILAPMADQPMQSLNRSVVFSPTHARLDLKAADESMVLLKNDGALPLGANVKTIAVIGPNAASIAALEGNYNGTPIDPETPLAAFKTLAAQNRFRILDVQGAPYVEQLSLPVPPNVFHTADGAEGLTETAFPNAKFSGPGITSTSDNIDSNWDGASPYPNRIPRKAFSVRWTGTLTPPAAGDIAFQVKLADCYPCDNIESYSVWVDGKQVSSGTSLDKKGHENPAEFKVHFADTKPHEFRLEYSHQSPLFGAGVSFNWQPPVDTLRQQAVDAAKQADAVVAFVGISPRLEGEEMPIHIPGFSGGDRTSIDLPDVQRQMLQAVAATGKPLIVVLMNGSALAVNWSAQHANAILEAWYPGARGGQAIVDTLLGKNNPAGRLPITFYRSTSELPPFTDYSMADRTYRYFHGATLYGFGYGLSYSQFKFDNLHVSTEKLKAGDPLTVDVDVTNTSKVDGDEVAELYLTYPKTKTSPIHALAGFSRVRVAAGATVPVQIKVDARQWSQVLDNGDRVILPGSYTLFVGGSQPGTDANGVSTTVKVAGKKKLPR
ncbi:MAG TPA: glycoside hydrolase family 3 C-terminal domain-containing protein [Acidobacteriaceae bacterium]|nr:glycoside hydrolase family 3 C-terminal domain-containing protein [Acidobacteriaceae bacterium]